MRTHYIYRATNKINNMSYIGQTVDFQVRKAEHERCRPEDDCIFHRAIAKYGKDNFTWTIIDETDSKEEANDLERLYIQCYRTYKPKGYNMTKGGDGGSMWNARPVVCLEKDGNYVRRYDSAGEAKRLDGFWDADVILCCKGLKRICCGKQFMYEDDYLKNGTKVYEKPESASMKAIVQCDLEGNFVHRYKSVSDASKKTGVGRSRISSALTGYCKTAGDYIWIYDNEFPIKDLSKYSHRKKGLRVAQIDPKTDKVIKVFDRVADAGRELGVSYKAIHKVVDLPGRTAYGFKWISQ